MAPDFSLTIRFPVPPDRIYAAWVDGDGHAAMTGAAASSDGTEGGRFSAWDGYITGEYLTLEPGLRITMFWRTTAFDEDDGDAHVDISLKADGEGTLLTLVQSDTPPDQIEDYKDGWEQFYFSPMRAFFAG
ncbi:MAG: SRPBCC domain-containing protein [Alphaproteobacteria bacterium]|nr:SRPBCC domain-containing protein [Alphaproteobacteria bacterium]